MDESNGKATWLDRLRYSFLSALIAVTALSVCLSATDLLYRTGPGFFSGALAVFIYGGGLSLAGWLLSLPFVLLVSNYAGWRYWTMLAVGTCLGPLIILLMRLYFAPASPTRGLTFELNRADGYATLVALLSSLLYLSFVRRQHVSPKITHDR